MGFIGPKMGVEDLDEVIQKVILDVLKRINKTIDKTARFTPRKLKSNIIKTLIERNGIGVTGNLSKYGNWNARYTKTKKNIFDIEANNLSAPYWTYLANPYGPYPYDLDEGLLRRWVESKFTDPGLQFSVYNRLLRTLPTTGHKSKKLEGFVDDALFRTVMGFFDDLKLNLQTEFAGKK